MKIVLSADDFGRSHTRNLAIDYAFRNGIIKSAALLVNSDYTEEAIEMANGGGYLDKLHCHLNLAYGEEMSGNSKPLNEEFSHCDVFCEDGEFKRPFYNKYDFMKWVDITYKELQAQYDKFKLITQGKGNLNHLDIHIYNNRSYPFAVAYRRLIKNNNIKSARYYAVHHNTVKFDAKELRRIKISKILCGKRAFVIRSDNIDYFLTKTNEFKKDDCVELYVHPDYRDGILMDETSSVFGHKKKSLAEHIELVKNLSDDFKFISWNDLL